MPNSSKLGSETEFVNRVELRGVDIALPGSPERKLLRGLENMLETGRLRDRLGVPGKDALMGRMGLIEPMPPPPAPPAVSS